MVRVVDGERIKVYVRSDGRAIVDGSWLTLPEAIVDASASVTYACLLGEHGNVYLSRTGRRLLLPCPVVSISCGYPHLTVALSDGRVFVITSRSMQEVCALPSPARRVFSGMYNCAALCASGEVYSWGAASALLGHEGRHVARVPLPGRVVDVGLGRVHAAALLADGALYVWGQHGAMTPARVFPGHCFTSMAVGRSFYAAATCKLIMVSRGDKVSWHITPQPVTALTASWASRKLRCETRTSFATSAVPSARCALPLSEYRWQARRVLLTCVTREQARPLRKRRRACADGAWTGKLPIDVWRTVATYL